MALSGAELEIIRRSLVLARSVPQSVAERLLAEVHRLRGEVERLEELLRRR